MLDRLGQLTRVIAAVEGLVRRRRVTSSGLPGRLAPNGGSALKILERENPLASWIDDRRPLIREREFAVCPLGGWPSSEDGA